MKRIKFVHRMFFILVFLLAGVFNLHSQCQVSSVSPTTVVFTTGADGETKSFSLIGISGQCSVQFGLPPFLQVTRTGETSFLVKLVNRASFPGAMNASIIALNFGTTIATIPVTIPAMSSTLSGGTISIGTTTVAYNTSPGSFTSSAPASGGSGGYDYQWQQSTNNGSTWSSITGATSLTYSCPALTQSTRFRRRATSGSLTAFSNEIGITVLGVCQITGVDPPVLQMNGLPNESQLLTLTGVNLSVLNPITFGAPPFMQFERINANQIKATIISSYTYTNPSNFSVALLVQGSGNPPFLLPVSIARPIVIGGTNDAEDLKRNWTESLLFNENEEIISWGRNYADGLGRTVQSQAYSFSQGKAIVSQPVYDALGRPVMTSLPALINQPFLAYKSNFITNASGGVYNFEDFDLEPTNNSNQGERYNPKPVGTQSGTLGWFYSSENTAEPYVDKTGLPYTRVEYSKTQPGAVRKTTLAGNAHKLGSGREYQTYSMPAADNELERFLSFDSDIEYKGLVKTISVDQDGKQAITYSNRDGLLIATCLSGTGNQTPFSAVYQVNSPLNYVDIHLPQGKTGFTLVSGTITRIVDLSTDANVNYSASSGNVNLGSSGFFRVVGSGNLKISFSNNNYYQYSFNVYDKAGRLIRTYSPLAVKNNTPNICTQYTYNSLGWLLKVVSPDEGTTNYVYRKDGGIRFSQNAQQKSDKKFSYTNYDVYGRAVESGEFNETAGNLYFSNAAGQIVLTGETILPETGRTQRHRTWFDDDGNEKLQNYVMGAVSKTDYDGHITWYSYTYDGKVEWVIRKHPGLPAGSSEKKVEYLYDFLGNVVEVAYQRGKTDQFIHYYTYDVDQQLSGVYTKRINDAEHVLQAKYYYYPHSGALKRVELAGNLQGIDYVYNINGMLKAINHPGLTNTLDPGADGNNGFRRDVFGLVLDYYSGDYLGHTSLATANGINSNYNGNIAMMRWGHINKSAGNNLQWAYKTGYNAQNYLAEALFGKYNVTTNAFTSESNYSVSGITYDANGNLLTLRRNGYGSKINMDLLTYNYTSQYFNRLDHVADAYGNAGLGDIESQTPGNYHYNIIGQLVMDQKNSQTFTYDVTGKVTRVTMPAGIADYKYDDGGFRSTTATPAGTTHYIRDVSGNILAVYNANGNVLEYPVYGGSRLGMAFVQGNTTAYNYEISDHLGNVRAIVSNTDPDVEGYADYYPFGWQMPGRIAKGSNTYRFGYQGQFAEDDTETTGYNQFEARLYDSRLGRWLTTDPAGQYYSPYLAMGNSPFMGVDPDGRFFGKLRANINAFFSGGEVVKGDAGNWYVLHADGRFKSFGQSGFRGKADLSHIKTSIEIGKIIIEGDFDEAPIFGGGEFNFGEYLYNNPAAFRYLMKHAGNKATEEYLFNSRMSYGREKSSIQVLAWTIGVPTAIIGGAELAAAAPAAYNFLSQRSAQLVLNNSSWLNKGNWWRLGEGWNPAIDGKNIRLAWGAHSKHLSKVHKVLRSLNQGLREVGGGHKHFPNWKP